MPNKAMLDAGRHILSGVFDAIKDGRRMTLSDACQVADTLEKRAVGIAQEKCAKCEFKRKAEEKKPHAR